MSVTNRWTEEDRDRDLFMLRELVEGGELDDDEDEAFRGMLGFLERRTDRSLSKAQRAWVETAGKRYQTRTGPPMDVPRGKEVPLVDVLKVLPKFPPGRKPA